MNLISIVMPAYNVGDYIAESIESIQRQTYTNWELIVVNDGSTDNTLDVLNTFAKQDNRIIGYSQDNAGVSAARNKGMLAAKGDFISFLDGDDIWMPTFLAEMTAKQTEQNSEFVCCNYARLDNGIIKKRRSPYPDKLEVRHFVEKPSHIHICGVLISKQLLQKNNISFTVGCKLSEDLEFILKSLLCARERGSIAKELMAYRKRPGSASNKTWTLEMLDVELRAQLRMIEFIRQQCHADQKRKLLSLFRQRLAYHLFRHLWKCVRTGRHSEINYFLGQFPDILTYLDVDSLSIGNKLKYHLVACRNKRVWRLSNVIFGWHK